MLYLVYYGSGDNWTLIETSSPIAFHTVLHEFQNHTKSRHISDFIDYINERFGEGMARRAKYQTVTF